MTPSRALIALDVGGSSVKSGIIIKGTDRPIGHCTTAIDSKADAETIIAQLAQIVRQHIATLDAMQPYDVVLGFPGPFDYEHGVSRITGVDKFEALLGLNIGQLLRERLPRPDVSLAFFNDAEASIIGEAVFGAGVGYDRVVGVTLGTGMGSSFLQSGIPVTEGENVPPHGWLFDQRWGDGIADEMFSTRGLEAQFARCTAGQQWSIPAAAESARQGNTALLSAFAAFGDEMGRFIQPHLAGFGAQALLLQGRITGTADLFLPALRPRVTVPVLIGMMGTDAALMGLYTQFCRM